MCDAMPARRDSDWAGGRAHAAFADSAARGQVYAVHLASVELMVPAPGTGCIELGKLGSTTASDVRDSP
jgi:hypothetical protein